jgi:hypothetical protein
MHRLSVNHVVVEPHDMWEKLGGNPPILAAFPTVVVANHSHFFLVCKHWIAHENVAVRLSRDSGGIIWRWNFQKPEYLLKDLSWMLRQFVVPDANILD